MRDRSASSLYSKYIWLVDTIYSAGHITRDEIDRRWAVSPVNDEHETSIPETTFYRWRNEVEMLFGLIIDCDRRTRTFFIANADAANKTPRWLLNTFALTSLVGQSRQMQDRILLEDMPSGSRYLTPVIESIRDGKTLHVTYQRFDSERAHTFEFEPYCLKTFKLRWYMVGRSSDHPTEVRVYALDRVSRLVMTNHTYTIPADFDAQAFFRDYYGVWTGGAKPEKVVIRVTERGADFLRSLPLHHSQQEMLTVHESASGRNDGYVVFRYFLAPTFDFIQELRTHGADLQVLAPEWLADDFLKLGKAYLDTYSVSPRT